MTHDPIVDEVRQFRDAYAKRFQRLSGNLFALLQRDQAASLR